jgi:hypothetical protein
MLTHHLHLAVNLPHLATLTKNEAERGLNRLEEMASHRRNPPGAGSGVMRGQLLERHLRGLEGPE